MLRLLDVEQSPRPVSHRQEKRGRIACCAFASAPTTFLAQAVPTMELICRVGASQARGPRRLADGTTGAAASGGLEIDLPGKSQGQWKIPAARSGVPASPL